MHRPLMIALASAVALGFAAATPASAAAYERAAVRVSYADLNLDNRAGAEVMLRRIERAAASVCGARNGTTSLALRVRINRCMDEEATEAVADLGHPGVTGLYYGRTPRVIVASR